MDITSFLTKEETIAGLEISDSHIRVCFFEKSKKEGTTTLNTYQERSLPEHAIKNGIIVDRDAVIKTLASIMRPLSGKIRYAIVTIPSECAYIKTFTFPKAIQGKKLRDAMDLTIGFQLPLRAEDVYLDWESTEDRSVNEVMLAASPKPVIDGYIAALSGANINPVAIEPHIFAVLRSIDIPHEAHTLIVDTSSTSAILFWIANKGTIRFTRSIPERFASQKEAEIRKISAAYEAEYGVAPTVVLFENATARKDADIRPDEQLRSSWLAGIGAARRGVIPRAQDSLISLMPMGTVEAYRQQRLVSFIEFIANATIGIAIFFAVAFIGTWALISSLQQRTSLQVESLATLPIPSDTGTLEARAKMLNELTNASHRSIQKIPHWSGVIEEVRKRTSQGITVTNAAFPSPEDALTVTGVAANREQLTAFKRSMEESPLFTEISLPPTNLEVRESIPFSLSFRLKDPTAVYIP